MTKQLNIVFLGIPFPKGPAMTKRWRYMVDYLNDNGIESHCLVAQKESTKKCGNPKSGEYGKYNTYIDISEYAADKQYHKYVSTGKSYLKKWFNPQKKNILVSTTLKLDRWPFVKYACKLGYMYVPDIVETTYLQSSDHRSLPSWIYQKLSDKLMDKYLRVKADAAIVISTNLKEEVLSKSPNLNVCILQNSTVQLSKLPRKELNSTLQILYSGTYAPKDGVKYLLDGVIKAHENGCRCQLTLLGKGAKDDMDFLSWIGKYPFIQYKGFVSDEELDNYLRHSDVLCMTRCNSRFANYGFPFKLSEYLSTGNVVLATKVGDVPMYLTDRKDSYLINPESSDEIANILIYIQTHPDESVKIASEGLRTMQKVFSIETVGKKIVEFLTEL